MKKKLTALAAIFSLFAAEADNLVANGNFEEIDSDGYFRSYSRAPEWSSMKTQKSAFLPDGNSFSGNFSARYDSMGQGGFISHPGMELKPGRTYRFSAMIRTDLEPVMTASLKASPPPGAFIQLMPVLPANWRGAWPKLGLPRLIAGGGKQAWKKYTGYFKADATFNKVWFGIYIMQTKGSAWFDDIELVESTPEEAAAFAVGQTEQKIPDGENLMFNSSFELSGNGDMPDFLYSAIGAAWFEKEWNTRRVESDSAPDGKAYFHLAGKFSMITSPIPTEPGREISLSFAARSDTPGQQGIVSFNGNTRTFEPGREWRRFHFRMGRSSGKTGRLHIGIKKSRGTLDIDAVMLHYGTEQMQYRPSGDEQIFQEILAARKKTFFASGTKEIRCDASFLLPGNPETKITLSRKDGELFVTAECFEPEMDKLVMRRGAGDWMVPNDDSVSVALLSWPEHGSMASCIFTVNADGAKVAKNSSGKRMNLPWEASAARSNGKWTASFRIPEAVLKNGTDAAEVWGFNLCRNRPENKGRLRMLAVWNGDNLLQFGKLRIGKAVSPAPAVGEMKYVVGKDNKIIFEFPADAGEELEWNLRFPSGKTFPGKMGNGILRFREFGKLQLAEEKYAWLEARKNGKLVFFRQEILPDEYPVFRMDFRYNVAFRGKGNQFRAIYAGSESERNDGRLELVFTEAGGSVVRETFRTAPLNFTAGTKLPPGEYSVSGIWKRNGRENTLHIPWKFQVVPEAERFCRVDRFARMVEKNGHPYFPCTLGFSLAWKFLDRISEIKKAGYNSVYVWGADIRGKYDHGKLSAVYDRLAEASLDAISYTPLDRDEESLIRKYGGGGGMVANLPYQKILNTKKAFLEEFKDKRSILMWSHYDEIYNYWEKPPVSKKESLLTDCQRELRKLDPLRLHWNNSVMSNRLFGGPESTDISSATIYTIRNAGGVAETINAGEGLADVGAKLGGTPSVAGMWLQFYNGSGEVGSGGREPSFREVRCMMYGCAIKGIRAFWFFNMRPLSSRLYEETGKTAEEMAGLADIFADGIRRTIRTSNVGVPAAGFEKAGKLWILSVNTSYSASSAAFSLPPGYAGGTAEGMFGTSPEKVKRHILRVSYKPLERKVFVIHKNAREDR